MWKVKIRNLLDEALRAFQRFPHVIICSLVFTLLLCYDEGMHHSNAAISKLLMTFGIGIPAYFALAVFDERYTMRRKTAYLFHGILAALLFLYWITLPPEITEVSCQRYFMLIILVHLCVSLAPFLVNGSLNGFWQYNVKLLIRFLTCSLFSLLLMGGIAFALYTTKQLFNLHFITDSLPYIFYFIITLNTWFFLMGIPQDVQALDIDYSYPNLIKVFSAYVLLPLVILFFIILYAYSIKTFAGNGPEEILVSRLIIALSVSGILVYLLLWPLAKSDNFWIAGYHRYFFPLLFPLVIILAVLTAQQIQSSFLKTENFIIIIYCITLALISGVFIFGKRKNIRLIPILLIIGIFAAGFGPWNAFESCRKNLIKELIVELQQHGRFKNGLMISSSRPIEAEEGRRIAEMLDYLERMYGLEVLQPYMDDPLKKILFVNNKMYNKRMELLSQLNISEIPLRKPLHYYTTSIELIKVEGYDYYTMISVNAENDNIPVSDLLPDSSLLHWNYLPVENLLSVYSIKDTVFFNLSGLYDSVIRYSNDEGLIKDPLALQLEQSSGSLKVQLNVQNLTLLHENKSEFNTIYGYILFSIDN